MRMSLFVRNGGRVSLPAGFSATVTWLAAVCLSASCAWAQPGTSATPAAGTAPLAGATQTPPPVTPRKLASVPPNASVGTSGPRWSELTPAQQTALKPLVANWDGLTESHKRKWLSLSRNYPNMTAAEQAKLQSRMTEWVTLSAQQRTQARLNYANAKTISPSEKKAKWQAYQALSAEEKRKLATKAPPPPKGAAPAVKPVPTDQLTVVPTSRHSAKPGQKIAASPNKVDKNTLLPRPRASTPQTPASAPDTATAVPLQPKVD